MTTVRQIAGVQTVHVGDAPSEPVTTQVRDVQKGLNELAGWARVRTDGRFDRETAAEVRRFQGTVGLEETGDIDGPTIEALNRELARMHASRAADEALEAEVTSAMPGSATVREAARTLVEGVGRGRVDSSARAERTYATEDEARAGFQQAAARMLDVHRWNELSGAENATFELFDRGGHPVDNRLARPGDFVRIQLPGVPGDDWVRIEHARATDDAAAIVVRPSANPTDPTARPDRVDHFFTAEATNTFSVERNGTTVTARVEGRNERPNVGRQSEELVHAMRNRVIVEGAWGAQLRIPGTQVTLGGMQQHQWNRFVESCVGGAS